MGQGRNKESVPKTMDGQNGSPLLKAQIPGIFFHANIGTKKNVGLRENMALVRMDLAQLAHVDTSILLLALLRNQEHGFGLLLSAALRCTKHSVCQ